jgi:nucleoside-diphosphate kinase
LTVKHGRLESNIFETTRDWEQTLLLVKPDAVQAGRTGEILRRIEAAGFRITGLVMRRLSRTEAERFYAVHRSKEFFAGLVDFITSGPVVAVRLEAESARRRLRELVGNTDPAQAAVGTIRHDFGTSVRLNAVHAANPEENADAELAFFFPVSAKTS